MNARAAKIVLVCILWVCIGAPCFASKYRLLIDPKDPTSGSVRLAFDRPPESGTKLVTRDLNELNSIDPICVSTGELLVRQEEGWFAQPGCAEVSWKVEFEAALEPNHNVSNQKNLYYADEWWLFTEWGDLLRPESDLGHAKICAIQERTQTCRRVPKLSEPPLFLLVGEPAMTKIVGETTFRFFSGHLPVSLHLDGLFESYNRQITYLYSVLGHFQSDLFPRGIDVLVLGIDRSQSVVGGAAGATSFLANVAVSSERVEPPERVRLLWVSGHELAHMLGLGAEALWASESLAHYYGFKSLNDTETASVLFDQMVQDAEGMGLLEAHQRVTRRGQGEYYGLFYSKGAAFWKEIDEAITTASGDKRSLDDLLPLVINGGFGADGTLPSEFVEAVGNIVGQDIAEKIISKYL